MAGNGSRCGCGCDAVRQIDQVLLVASSVGGRRAAIVADQRGEVAAVVDVPGPGEVADAVLIEPVHGHVDEAVRAVVFADFSGNDRYLRGYRLDVHYPAIDVIAGVEVVQMERGDQIVQG